jgi:hypothetical protein
MKWMLTILAAGLMVASAVADVVPTVQWDVETGRLVPVPYTLSIRRGESAHLQPRFLTYNSPMTLTGATVHLRYWYTGQTGYYATTGSLMAATGRVQIAWYEALCPASNALNYEVRCTVGTNVLARAYGPLNLLTGTSGTETNGQVRTSINWSLVDQTGGPAVLSNQMGSGATWNGSAWTFSGSGGTSENFGTNAAFLAVSNQAAAALPASATNGAEWGSHAGLVSTGSLGTAAYSNSGAFATAAQGAKADTALQAEADTLQSVANRSAGTATTNLPALDGGTWAIGVYGRMARGYGLSLMNIAESANGAQQSGVNAGSQTIGAGASGAQQNGANLGMMVIGETAPGAQQYGYTAPNSYATNNGAGAVQLLDLTDGQIARTTADGDGSLLLGPGISSNRYAIVAGSGNVSHGDGSITAGGGFWGSGANLSGITASQVGAVAVDDARYLASLTNRAFVTATPLNCSPTTTITRAMIDAAPWGRMTLSLTQACYLTLDATVTGTTDAATFALYISGTNTLLWNTNQLTGSAWTNATANGSNRLFDKPPRAGTVEIW